MNKIKKNKYEITFKILDMLGHAALSVIDITDMMLEGYPKVHLSKIKYKEMMQRIEKHHSDLDLTINYAKESQRFYSLMNKLQGEGLVKKQKKVDQSSFWISTKKGELKKNDLLQKIKKQQANAIPDNLIRKHIIEPSLNLIVVIFDIHEKEKNKRTWLRDVLRNLEFKMTQKSVWMGKNKIPIELIEDLRKLNLLPHVKIFSVIDDGSIATEI